MLMSMHQVSKLYGEGESEIAALREIDLDIDAGEFVALMGPSGSGKSTCLNILGCLDVPSRGEYLFMDVPTSRFDNDQRARLRRRYLGFVFQGFNLLPRTSALENVELPLMYGGGAIRADERRKRARRSLARVGLAGRERHPPSRLSGGEQQRVAIARALITDPPLILADEPTGNLDSHTSEEVLAIFQELNDSGKTIVLITHEADVARHARRQVVFRDGRIVLDQPLQQQRVGAQAGASA
jgi:putative ABC transport system ATP-binding protein